jgi:hypothetical protein
MSGLLQYVTYQCCLPAFKQPVQFACLNLLYELGGLFDKMKSAGIPDTEHIPSRTFWTMVKSKLKEEVCDISEEKPCECTT